ncbi:phosphoenolpyruvate--protein phosphotransferase [Sphingomonas yabuuchiae]|uniref:phosphoenolpyruvate--protein phosphotransferase n=1 Tax=Sphingomonas yabuuchiae TaxID=172044 RepID=A0AA40ZZC0_9SPHN|nr:phosphoenolpyruvate--protein phosphotransferase [Sphingomonas yabuuchiae]MBB4610049.1 phosphoenolpyruvate-protein phosphotransferase [Sphingomonas yabuuchiae]MBN3557874.1 phosphoenolpyruvate--protein phosphotransferase [Sphingomonas yabuuchiae]
MSDLTVFAPLAGWVTPLAEVPDPVFAEKMLGDGVAIDPVNDALCAPCDATVLTVHEAGHAVTLRSTDGYELICHIGIDTVSLGGKGLTPQVQAGAKVLAGQPLIRFDLDYLVQNAPAVVTPIIVADATRYAVEPIAKGLVAVGDPLLRVVPLGVETVDADIGGDMLVEETVVALSHGLHARPAARLVEAVRKHDARVTLYHGDRHASALSAVGLLGLGLGHGTTVRIEASGAQAAAALAEVIAFLNDATPEETPVDVPEPVRGEGPGLGGVPAAPGLAVGPIHRLTRAAIPVETRAGTEEEERTRLNEALDTVREGLARAAAAGGARGGVMAAHGAMLADPTLTDAALAMIGRGMSAGVAWQEAISEQVAVLLSSGDRRIAERADDLRDLERHVLAALAGLPIEGPSVPQGAILVAEDLLPSQVAALDAAVVAGIALVKGGPTSHAAILAAGMGLPMAVAFGEPLAALEDGRIIVLDADRGLIDPEPDAEAQGQVRDTIARRKAEMEAARAAQGPCRMADGTRIEMFANLGSVADAEAAVAEGAEGCGLLRTEFLFLERATAPTRDEQARDYQAIADALGDRPMIVRLLDVGGDKPAPYMDLPVEENPALGLRGIRVSLADPRLLEDQVAAILAVRQPCRIMAPMIASLSELEAVRAVVERHGRKAEVGVMIETPAAAISADILARKADFFSIGTNDLTQYTLAMDRGNAAVAAGVDGLHPAVLRLIGTTCDGAARHDTPVGVCGSLAADRLAVPILLGLGVSELSVPPARVAAIKALVGTLDMVKCRAAAIAALALPSAAAVRAHITTMLQEIGA